MCIITSAVSLKSTLEQKQLLHTVNRQFSLKCVEQELQQCSTFDIGYETGGVGDKCVTKQNNPFFSLYMKM